MSNGRSTGRRIASLSQNEIARCAAVGALCVLAALLGQFTLVHFCYQGNWTGLFFTGDSEELPAELADEDIYRFENSDGYDGQYYHYVAHDPFRRRGLAQWIDAPELRYQRILVPLSAWVLAGGSDAYVDFAYYVVVLLFVFLGGYWSSRFVSTQGRHPLFGLIFLLVPSVLVSLERLTVEIALAALTAGFALYATRGPAWKLYLVLVAAVLTRETGLFLVAACALSYLARTEWLRAVRSLSAALPGLVWIFLVTRMPHSVAVIMVRGGSRGPRYLGLIRRLFRPLVTTYSSLTAAQRIVAWITDEIALAGMVLGSVLGIRMAVRRHPDPLALTAALSGVVALLFIGPWSFWASPVGYTRPFTSLFVILGLRAIADRRILLLLPLLLNDLRLVVELGPRLLVIFGLAPA